MTANDMGRLLKKFQRQAEQPKTALQILLSGNIWQLTGEERTAMTISCRDCDYIPKVKNAGGVMQKNGQEVQVMHNGVLVKKGGYHGEWMSRIIKELRGHHEPQEEKIFYELLQRIRAGGVMIELGAFWSYYSLWFHKHVKRATNYCCEPDPGNMAVGQFNALLNQANLNFIQAAAGSKDGDIIQFDLESKPGEKLAVPIKSVDSLVAENKLAKIDMLHMDVQGAELETLKGAAETITAGKLRFLIVSTHHYLFSGDPLSHHKCLDYITSLGGYIISSHTVAESYSGDGLIAASFDPRDRELAIEVSLNHTDRSLFRPHEKDLAILMKRYDDMVIRKKQ
jgi:FkbM family methyltransferase